MPRIDSTTAVLFAVGSVVVALVLCTVLRRHKMSDLGIRWLTASNLAFLLAAGATVLSPRMGLPVSATIIIGAVYCGIVCAWFAVLATCEKAVDWRRALAVGLGVIVPQGVLAAIYQDVELLMLTSSLVNSTMLAYVVTRVWSLVRPHSQRLASLLCMPFAMLLTGYFTRIPVLLIWQDQQTALLTTLIIIMAMAWASVILELGMIALREAQNQTELRAALLKAEAAERARTRFLLAISHELRTPLNAILGLSELMRNQVLGSLPTAYEDQANHIHRHGAELNELVSDLLIEAAGVPDECGDMNTTYVQMDDAVHEKFAETNMEAFMQVAPRKTAP